MEGLESLHIYIYIYIYIFDVTEVFYLCFEMCDNVMHAHVFHMRFFVCFISVVMCLVCVSCILDLGYRILGHAVGSGPEPFPTAGFCFKQCILENLNGLYPNNSILIVAVRLINTNAVQHVVKFGGGSSASRTLMATCMVTKQMT